jgi:hypothetical protein
MTRSKDGVMLDAMQQNESLLPQKAEFYGYVDMAAWYSSYLFASRRIAESVAGDMRVVQHAHAAAGRGMSNRRHHHQPSISNPPIKNRCELVQRNCDKPPCVRPVLYVA